MRHTLLLLDQTQAKGRRRPRLGLVDLDTGELKDL
jgi:hypothetical protein